MATDEEDEQPWRDERSDQNGRLLIKRSSNFKINTKIAYIDRCNKAGLWKDVNCIFASFSYKKWRNFRILLILFQLLVNLEQSATSWYRSANNANLLQYFFVSLNLVCILPILYFILFIKLICHPTAKYQRVYKYKPTNQSLKKSHPKLLSLYAF